jgi:hypothetical protein
MNAVSHGLRAASPVVPGEDPAAWEAYRDALASDLAPVGVLEADLADRVALLSWRLRRVSAYEAGAITYASDQAARRVRGEEVGASLVPPFGLPRSSKPTLTTARNAVKSTEAQIEHYRELRRVLDTLTASADDTPFDGDDAMLLLGELPTFLPDGEDRDELTADDLPPLDPQTDATHPRFLTAIGIVPEHHDDAEGWAGWTAGVARLGADRIAKSAKWTGAKLLAKAAAGTTAALEQERAELADRRLELAAVEQTTVVEEAEGRRRSLVPSVETVEVVIKYEGHLQRQLVQALHELERRQALRSDCPPHPPAAVDVTLHTPAGVMVPGLAAG